MARYIKVSGEEREVKPHDGKLFTLKELQDFVKFPCSKTIDIVPLPSGKQMVVNDNGKIFKQPVNEKATKIFADEYPIAEYPFNNNQDIVGDVLICDLSEIEDEEDEDEDEDEGIDITDSEVAQDLKKVLDDMDEECEHEWVHGRCTECGEVYEPADFSGATPGDR